MKNTLIIIVLSILMFGCTSRSSQKQELSKKETKLLQDNSLGEKREEYSVDKENQTDRNYLLLDKSVGKFKIGSSIPFPKTSDNYRISEETQIRMTEEGEEEETVYIVKKEEKELMQLKLKYDYDKEQYTQTIEEIILTSPTVKTVEGIGVSATIEDFTEQYPDYHIWYTYISGMYVIEAKDINAQFILDEKDFIGNINITSDMITLKKSDFKQGAKIIKIRVF